MTPEQQVQAISEQAFSLGFSSLGFAPAQILQRNQDAYDQAIAEALHASMTWLENRLDQRKDPQKLWDQVRTAIVLGYNYGPEQNPLPALERKSEGYISVYARGDDYHDVIKKKLKVLGSWMAQNLGADLKVFVDTAPVPEKALALLTQVGWQGKHSNIVSKDFGSWLFLGVIYTNLDLPKDLPMKDHCGSCDACMRICPTQAIIRPHVVDARACISYLTIEHQGSIDHRFRKAIGNRIYGCDDCLAVCPWNKFAQQAQDLSFAARDLSQNQKLISYLSWDEAQFREAFRKSPIKRIGWARWIRNCLIAAGNSKDPELIPSLQFYQKHEDSVIAEAASWALQEIRQ